MKPWNHEVSSFSDHIWFNTLEAIENYSSMTTINYKISTGSFNHHHKVLSRLFTVEEHRVNDSSSDSQTNTNSS
jgi:hypothetical protein